jgi:hypothetical protein
MKELLELYINCQAKTRKIKLFWELDEEGKDSPPCSVSLLTENKCNGFG